MKISKFLKMQFWTKSPSTHNRRGESFVKPMIVASFNEKAFMLQNSILGEMKDKAKNLRKDISVSVLEIPVRK